MRDIVITCRAIVDVQAIQCVSCGAPLQPGTGGVVTCSYCGRAMRLSGASPELTEPEGPRRASDDLLQGYQRDVGEGRRYTVADMAQRDWPAAEHGVWPVGARASSSFGGGWSPRALLGHPAVFPRDGDISGAWAPRARTSHVEWAETDFPEGVGPVSAVRVFETHVVGSVFAVTITGERGVEEVVWQRRPEALGAGARVLEVPLSPPRVVKRARAYLTNSGNRWAEIDTIGLLAVEPVPEHIRARFKRRRSYTGWIIGAIVVSVIGAFLWVGHAAGRAAAEQARAVPTPSKVLQASTVRVWEATPTELTGVGIVWAQRAPAVSSQYGEAKWSAAQATGAPDTFPVHEDRDTAWATRGKDDGTEWIELVWPQAVTTRRIVVVETFNPGALARIDDLTQDEPVALWLGNTLHDVSSRVLVIELPEPRSISVLRVVLDTRRAQGWNEIDAVGLQPER